MTNRACKKKILMVEDEPDFRLGVRMRLEAHGYEVIEAHDGTTGLDLARDQKPDLIILDIMLPADLDGYQVAHSLKTDTRYCSIPIVMLTARVQQCDRDRAKAVGADAYVVKPFKAEELLQVISSLLTK